ncbi:MAG: hypothetical protein H6726_20150 [Sandaracinaceae bacterium]|nr:hypothetical protein [Myxococcales bacterium]MCB9659973.1 hypothetical protein [Sandaracinaceae bacterium]
MQAQYSSKFTILMTLGIAWASYRIVTEPPSWRAVLIMLVLCYFVTDVVSGMLHIILDNPRSLDIKFIAPLAQGFQNHHNDPEKIFRELSLYQHLYVMHLPLTLFFFAVLPFNNPLVFVGYLGMVAMLHLMQMSHRWAHVPDAQRGTFVTMMQRVRFIIPYAAHAKHHVDPYDHDFCIMSGLGNKPLNLAARALGVRTHGWIPIFLLTCTVPIGVGLAMHYAGV